jgi:hypothetical protein
MSVPTTAYEMYADPSFTTTPEQQPWRYGQEFYESVLTETILDHNSHLQGLASDHRQWGRETASIYRQYTHQTDPQDAYNLFYELSSSVEENLTNSELAVRTAIWDGAQKLESKLAPEDTEVLARLRDFARAPGYGIGSYDYNRTLDFASSRTSLHALEKIMDWEALGILYQESNTHGVRAYETQRAKERVSRGAQAAVNAAQDLNVFNAAQNKFIEQTPYGDAQPRRNIDWYSVDDTVQSATPGVRDVIAGSLDIHVLTLAEQATSRRNGADRYLIERAISHGSNRGTKALIQNAVSQIPGVERPRVWEPPTPGQNQYREPLIDFEPLRNANRKVASLVATAAVAAVAIFGGAVAFGDRSPQQVATTVVAPGNIAPCFPTVGQLPVNNTAPPHLTLPVVNGSAEGSGVPSESLTKRTTDTIVEITTSLWKGTGVITTDANGNEVVVTAGHVVGAMTASDITITTQNGTHVKPDGGCYLYGTGGDATPLTNAESPVQDTDIAVLTLAQPLTSDPLPIANSEPKAGQKVAFVNYQTDWGPNDSLFNGDATPGPASYDGIIAPEGALDSPDVNVS